MNAKKVKALRRLIKKTHKDPFIQEYVYKQAKKALK